MSTEIIAFTPSDESAPPFQCQTSIAEGLVTLSVTWNMAAERWYIRVQNSSGDTWLYRPLIGSPMTNDINLISTISTSKIVYRADNSAFEITL